MEVLHVVSLDSDVPQSIIRHALETAWALWIWQELDKSTHTRTVYWTGNVCNEKEQAAVLDNKSFNCCSLNVSRFHRRRHEHNSN